MWDPDLELLLKYPLISSQTQHSEKHYTGRILCGSRDFELHLVEDCKIRVETRFGGDIDPLVASITAPNIVEFIDKLVEVLKNSVSENLSSVYRRVLHEYSEFTNFHLTLKSCKIAFCSQMTFSFVDEGGREHFIHIAIDVSEPKEIYRPLPVDLPQQVLQDFPKKSAHLTEIYRKFVRLVEGLQLFFGVMDDLDGGCVLDPEIPTRKDCHRRIWLDETLSVMVIVDPLNTRARPELKFLGPEHVVEPQLQKLEEKLEDWDENGDFLEGLLKLLGLEIFPVKPQQDQVMLMDTGECSICFSSRLNNKLPEVICDNKSCGNFYHVECLFEWLSSINSRRIFYQLHGQCPNCEKKIVCPIPHRAVPC